MRIRPAENDRERAHRLRMEARAFRVKEAPAHILAIAVMASVTVYGVWALFRPDLPKEDRDWAISVLSHLLVAVAGFAFGKAAK